jgi:ABC-2 type transport system permease protein
LNIVFIARRELAAFFLAPLSYTIAAGFLFITGLFFYFTITVDSQASLAQVFTVIGVMMLFTAPILTMRLLAEENQSGTMELLLTSPVRDAEVVLGKFIAAFLFFVALLIPTFFYLFILIQLGQPYLPAILTGYLGLLLLGAMLLSIGVLTSAASASQIVAAAAGIVISAGLWLMGGFGLTPNSPTGTFLRYLTIQEHFTDFLAGLISLANVLYFVSVTAAALFLAIRTLELRRWH